MKYYDRNYGSFFCQHSEIPRINFHRTSLMLFIDRKILYDVDSELRSFRLLHGNTSYLFCWLCLWHLDKGHFAAGLFLDLPTAFDVLKLNFMRKYWDIGFRTVFLKWHSFIRKSEKQLLENCILWIIWNKLRSTTRVHYGFLLFISYLYLWNEFLDHIQWCQCWWLLWMLLPNAKMMLIYHLIGKYLDWRLKVT